MPYRTYDARELDAYAKQLGRCSATARALVVPPIRKGAVNIKESIKKDLRASAIPQFRRIPITFEMVTEGSSIGADIMPGNGGAGALANIAFFGTARGGGTHRFYEHANAKELSALQRYIGKAAAREVS